MIEKLTDEQEKQMIDYREKCRLKGLSCNPVDKEKAKLNITKLYQKIGKKQPYFWFCDSLFQAEIVLNILNNKLNLGENLEENLKLNLEENLRKNLRENLRGNLGENLRENLWGNLWGNLRENLRENLEENLRKNLRENLRENLRGNLKFYTTNFWGQMDYFWVAFYSFPEQFLEIEYKKEDRELLHIWNEIVDSCCWFWTYEDICIVSDRPEHIKLNSIYQLHCENGMAIKFRDGYGLYSLNGVRVPKEIVETPAEKIDVNIILKETNAEIRREIVRKVGIERVCLKLNAKVIDKKDGYELLNLDLGDGRQRPYLKMKNPSIGTYHLEGIPVEIQTVNQALIWRNGTEERPIILT